MTEVKHDLGEVKDRTKNAHHRIDETNTAIKELREDMNLQLSKINSKVENIGINLANKDRSDRKWRKVTIIIGVLAIVSFVGLFIRNSEVMKVIGEMAVKVGVGVASTI